MLKDTGKKLFKLLIDRADAFGAVQLVDGISLKSRRVLLHRRSVAGDTSNATDYSRFAYWVIDSRGALKPEPISNASDLRQFVEMQEIDIDAKMFI